MNPSTPNCPYLFVYGTLRRGSGHPMSRYLGGRARRLGEAQTRGSLLQLARYPGMVRGAGIVHGELYKLQNSMPTLRSLDAYEGKAFARELASCYLRRIGPVTAWLYRYRGKINGAQIVASGDYLRSGR